MATKLLSQAIGILADTPLLPAFFHQLLIRWYVRKYQVSLGELRYPLNSFRTLADFFARELRPEVRPVHPGLVSIVDGTLLAEGDSGFEESLEAKSETCPMKAFIPEAWGREGFFPGVYFHFYLSPKDYHRVHAPLHGRVVGRFYSPGPLWPVNSWAIRWVPNVFARNERVSLLLETERGRAVIVLIGALNVGKIDLLLEEKTTYQLLPERETSLLYPTPYYVEKGQALAIFRLGSSALLFLDKELSYIFARRKWRQNIPVQCGETLLLPRWGC